MTAAALHPAPAAGDVLQTQLRTTAAAARRVALGLFAVVGLSNGALVLAASGLVPWLSLSKGDSFAFDLSGSGFALFAGILFALGAWRADSPSRRAYHWTMPVGRGPHTVAKVVAGWGWAMAAVAAVLLIGVASHAAAAQLAHRTWHVVGGGWQWAMPFGTATVVYLLISVPLIGSNHAWWWIVGIALVTAFGFMTLYATAATNTSVLGRVSYALLHVLVGEYGLVVPIAGVVYPLPIPLDPTHAVNSAALMQNAMFGLTGVHPADRVTWIKATAVWIAAGWIGVGLASYWYRRFKD